MQPPKAKSADPEKLDRDELRAVGLELGKHFPQPIEETNLVLMEISPHQLHAYWHITPWDLEAATRQIKDKEVTLVLRFHDLTDAGPRHDSPPQAFDVEISKSSSNQYVEVWKDARRYVAELGIRTREGFLIDLARSNTVELPRAGYSTAPGTRVLTLTPGAETFFQQASADTEGSGFAIAGQQRPWQADESQPVDSTLEGGGTRLSPLFPDPMRPPESIDPASMDHDGDLQRHARLASPPDAPAENAKHILELDHYPLFLVADLKGAEVGRDTLFMSPWPMATTAVETTPGEMTGQGVGRSHTLNTLKSETSLDTRVSVTPPGPQPLSSFSTGGEPDQDLQMELLIRGRGRPNSQFVLSGLSIPVQEDGSFSLRQKLPASTLELVDLLLAASREK